MIDNVSFTNECEDKGGIGEVDDFESLDIDFHNVNETSMLSPSSKKSADTDDTSLRHKGQNYIRKKDIALCRYFINLSKNAFEGTEKMEIFWRDVRKLFGELMMKGAKPRDSINKIWSQNLKMNRLSDSSHLLSHF